MLKFCSLIILSVLTYKVYADVKSCTFTDTKAGKTYDFSSLISPAGYYKFSQQIWSVNGFSLDSLVADTQVNVTFYLQVCRNIVIPPTGCTDVGAIYAVTPDGKCQSWGNANVSVFDPNPYQDGVNLKMYHGTAIDHLSNNAGTIYFVCNQDKKNMRADMPTFEHVKAAINQAHFKIFTKLAC
ncbi:uncharacterized protein LOC123556895 [Mercenaria mercenaria]|uniref:uncharacterized protein LOC123556895 n=1 Tax=Mercenaria mercenaria TaxID=6596 RepID=UPI00234F3D9C|nr:uncharacterized protein LOC123556895 [Mercenaria mercenaria]